MPSLGLVLDIVLLGAIGAAMHRAWILSRQFEQARSDRAAFEQLISALNIAAGRAEAAIEGLKAAVTDAGDGLQSKVNAARALESELEIMLQAGDSLAERLQNAAEKSRVAAQADIAPRSEPARTAPPKAAEPRTRAEKELLDALRAKQDG
ncbi:MAG: hypothetical protein H3C49_05980 [Alphaproteobacteria bacterium]|nr:hypothetical protein [Alphaproteobacteria bacterium]